MAKINRLKVVLVEKEKSGKGKSTCTVSKWCSNTTQPDLQTLSKIAQLLNIDTRELLTPSTLQE
jgi:transcriptional regulator with XRE-family HTH domain